MTKMTSWLSLLLASNVMTNKVDDEEKSETVQYPNLQPRDPRTLPVTQYIAERFNGQISWYDKTATGALGDSYTP